MAFVLLRDGRRIPFAWAAVALFTTIAAHLVLTSPDYVGVGGLDPVLGLIPWIGDMTTPLFSAVLLLHAVRMRIPKIVQLRMLMNAAIDFGVGVVPVVGDLFDFGWKANVRNLALLERHAHPGNTAALSDWAFVLIVLGVLALLAITPVLLLSWLLSHLRW